MNARMKDALDETLILSDKLSFSFSWLTSANDDYDFQDYKGPHHRDRV